LASLQGALAAQDNQVVVAGAHLDSTVLSRALITRSPGANDNASGSSTLLEVFAALLQEHFRPLRAVQFHWYAAEEVYVFSIFAFVCSLRLTSAVAHKWACRIAGDCRSGGETKGQCDGDDQHRRDGLSGPERFAGRDWRDS
jgi:Peptidase family M28